MNNNFYIMKDYIDSWYDNSVCSIKNIGTVQIFRRFDKVVPHLETYCMFLLDGHFITDNEYKKLMLHIFRRKENWKKYNFYPMWGTK